MLVLAALLLPWLPLLINEDQGVTDGAVVKYGEPSVGDYDRDAGPALDRARDGRVWELYGGESPPLMMPLSLLLRLPALIIGQTDLDEYRAGVVLVMLAAAATALVFTEWWQRLAWVALLTLNPLSFEAIAYGHPEEVLLGAFVLAALVVAARGKAITAGVLAGLAIGTKQPAVLALLPVVLASPRRWRTFGAAVGTAALVIVPFLLPHLDALRGQAALARGFHNHASALAPSLWTLFGGEWVPLGPEWGEGAGHLHTSLPQEVVVYGKVWAVLAALLLSALLLVLARWRRAARSAVITAAVGALTASLALRVSLDPDTTAYYALPLLLVLLGWSLRAARPVLVVIALLGAQALLLAAGQIATKLALFHPADAPFGAWYANAWACGGALTLVALIAFATALRSLLRKRVEQCC